MDAYAEGHCKHPHDDTPVTAPNCTSSSGLQYDATGSAVMGSAAISDTGESPMFGFGNVATGPGALVVVAQVDGELPPTGFASVVLSTFDIASIPITWV